METSVISAVTARTADLLPQDSIPSLIWITFTMESSRKRQPITEPTAEPSIPSLSTLALMWALKASSTSLLLIRLIASLRPWAMREEKRKKLKETTSKTRRLRTTSGPASHAELFSRLRCPGEVSERPTKTAMVKSEFTFTSPSRAVTWMLVVLPFIFDRAAAAASDLEEINLDWMQSDQIRKVFGIG